MVEQWVGWEREGREVTKKKTGGCVTLHVDTLAGKFSAVSSFAFRGQMMSSKSQLSGLA